MYLKGITPAYAGNTCYRFYLHLPPWDHPRLRGEHPIFSFAAVLAGGSPPPTRGTPVPVDSASTVPRDHPRLRGEHAKRMVKKSAVLGSPPPTRGTRFKTLRLSFSIGITPAYAGNTLTCGVDTQGNRDHPRLRGEHLSMFVLYVLCLGSPPPTRGTQRSNLW